MTHHLLALVMLAAVGCGDDDDTKKMCTPGTSTGCMGEAVCEEVAGGDPACFDPVQIRGRVLDAASGAGIADATVVALDVNGGARSDVAVSGADGAYTLPIFVTRNADGTPTMDQVTLRVSAQGYQTFPTAPRTALPIDLGTAVANDGEHASIVMNAATDVALIAIAGDVAGLGTIEGSVDHDEPGGVLVVAVQGTAAVATAVTDAKGDFTLFNVPPGPTNVEGYRSGLAVTPVTVTATADAVTGVVLQASDTGLGTVSGSVNIVNGGMCDTTSVILVVESTFVENAARGDAPAGLRVTDISGAFSIPDVPPGRYVVLAAFENDDCVRDPDTSIGGTTIQHVEVPAAGGDVMLTDSFKITGALAVRSPGASGVETISDMNPTFVWEDDSSEDGYEVHVYDAFGVEVHANMTIPSVHGSGDVSYTMMGVALEEGMIYQFRAYSFHSDGARISATEDLKGVFLFDPTP